MDCGLPPALSAMLTEAKREPLAVGAKSTAMMQDVVGGSPDPPMGHGVPLATSWKSPGFVPVVPMLAMMRFALPTLVKVAVCAGDVLPTLVLGNVRAVVESVATAPAPVPVRGTDWGLPVALSATLMLAFAVPTALGAKSTARMQELLGATPEPLIGQFVLGSITN